MESTRFLERHRLSLGIFFVSLAVLALTSFDRLLSQSRAPHFVYQADAFLHGQLELPVPPPNDNDWIRRDGKTYVSFPPVPAVVMMPFVAIFGLAFNDVVFTLFFGALNVVLMFHVLEMLGREGLSPLSRRDNLWLTALFGFGTVHFCCAVLGEVWLTAQIMACSFTNAYVLCATRARRPFWAGVFLALAFNTRVNLAFTAIYFGLQLFFPRGPDRRFAGGGFRDIAQKAMAFAVPILAVGVAQMLMNYVRYEDPLEYGHVFLGGPAGTRIRQWGMFHYHYFEWNLHALLLRLPFPSEPPWFRYNPDGMSIFLTTPAFVHLFWPRDRPWLYPILWATAVPPLLMSLFYQNSGYVQFGYRFALDIMPYLVMLLAVGRVPMNRTTKSLILVGIVVNLIGAIVFKRFGPI